MRCAPPERLRWAHDRDSADPLSALRAQFALPSAPDGEPLIYLCGHSLGLAARSARALVQAEIDDWERLGVLGHEQARTPWLEYAERLQGPLATLAGALPPEVVAMNSLTVNLHLLLAAFFRPRGERRAILIESGAFPSDRYAVATQLRWHGLDPADTLIELGSRPGEDLLATQQIEAAIRAHGPRLALVLWPGVQYRTGQRFDIGAIARCAHAVGALAGFDLAHAIGNVPLALHAEQADFAVWCSYKYLNGGPGAIGGAFVHERHWQSSPALAGWWGNEPHTRFRMHAQFMPAAGASAYALSNPPILSAAPLRASLPLFLTAGMAALRERSRALSACLEAELLAQAPRTLTLVSPRDAEQRGCQLSWRIGASEARAICSRLAEHGVIADWREPDLLRLAPVPLYNSYTDVIEGAWRIAAALG